MLNMDNPTPPCPKCGSESVHFHSSAVFTSRTLRHGRLVAETVAMDAWECHEPGCGHSFTTPKESPEAAKKEGVSVA